VLFVQVWFTAAASADGASGSISSTIKTNGGEAQGQLYIEAVHVLGTGAAAAAADDFAVTVNGQAVQLAKAADGVLKVTGLKLAVGEPFAITWQPAAGPVV
jgi:hypothetical protein